MRVSLFVGLKVYASCRKELVIVGSYYCHLYFLILVLKVGVPMNFAKLHTHSVTSILGFGGVKGHSYVTAC